MTKKSTSRIARDKVKEDKENYIKDNTAWDDITDIYNHQIQYIREVINGVKNVFETPCIFSFFPKDVLSQVVVNLKAINSDAATYLNRIEAVHSNHKDKKGGVKDTEEFMLACQISEEYVLLNNEMVSVLTPGFNKLLAEGGAAIDRMIQASTEAKAIATETKTVETVDTTEVKGTV